MSRKKATRLDATAEIESDPAFHAEVLGNKRALDRGKGRLYAPSDLFKDEVRARPPKSARPAKSPRGGREARPTR